jgi:hypothetical protein
LAYVSSFFPLISSFPSGGPRTLFGARTISSLLKARQVFNLVLRGQVDARLENGTPVGQVNDLGFDRKVLVGRHGIVEILTNKKV